jgi:hypothetical protein
MANKSFLNNLREYSFERGNRTQTFKQKQCNYRYCQLLQRNHFVMFKYNFFVHEIQTF